MIPFVRQFDFAYGVEARVSGLISRVVADNPGPFTFTGTGTYIVGAADPGAAVAVIDPGPADARHLSALLDAVAGRTVSHVLVTHTHRDHSPLATPFARAVGAPILAAAVAGAPSTAGGGLDEAQDAAFAPDVVVADGDVIQGPDWTLKVVATPGHASNHLAFALIEENALFSGDHVMGWSTTVVAPPDGDMTDYLASLDRVIDARFETVWPTHGPPIRDVPRFLEAYRAHRLERSAQILERVRSGDGRIRDITPRLYAGVDPALWPAASLSTWAHLRDLERRGQVRSSPGPDLDAEWRPA